MGWEDKAARAKKGHRPSLKNWERDGLYEKFPSYAEALLSPSTNPYSSLRIDSRTGRAVEHSLSLERARQKRRGMSLPTHKLQAMQLDDGTNNEEAPIMYPIVLDVKDTPPELFHEQYEAKVIPCVIRNIPYGDSSASTNGNSSTTFDEEKKDCDDNTATYSPSRNQKEWPAVHRWSLDKLINDPDLAERGFKCGEDDDGYTIRMKLKYFIQYLQNNKDDSPLYILIGESKRPPYRWFLVGPCRSGTTVVSHSLYCSF